MCADEDPRKPRESKPRGSGAEARKARAAEALRENLRRRKQQKDARKPAPNPVPKAD